MKNIKDFLPPKLVCEKHGIHDVYACPWPNCENGLSEDQFKVTHTFSKKTNLFTRRKWLSPLGGHYYSWDGDDLPNWFSMDKVFWGEVKRHKILPQSFSNTMYHYTNLNGFKGIIDNGCIWLSDYSYLNDAEEITHGLTLISKVAHEMLDSQENEATKKLISACIENIKIIDHRICIASFSSNGDSLSQWRSYGDIAIGFDTSSQFGYLNETRLTPVEYNDEIQKQLIKMYLSHMSQTYYFSDSFGKPDFDEIISYGTRKLLDLITSFKNRCFSRQLSPKLLSSFFMLLWI